MKSILFFALLIITASASATDSLGINYGGVARDFFVHTPPGFAPGQHLPMVFNFHGYGSNARQEEFITQMDNTADTANFIVIYPDGINSAWNVGWAGSFWTGPDDVGFTSALIDTMIKLYGIDTTRVYSCGLSNGGFLSHVLACVLNNRIAAIAAVSGTVTDSAAAYCQLTRKIPVMDIHGTADPVVPYDTFPLSLNVEQTISFWVGQDLCATTSDTVFVPNTDTTDGSTVQKIDYAACADGAEALFYKIINGGHTWPNALFDLPPGQYGNTNRDIDANTEIWHFFNKYKLNITTAVDAPRQPEYDVRIFPNPLDGKILHIESDYTWQNALVEIFGAGGGLIFKTPARNNTDLENLTIEAPMVAGVYTVRISSDKNYVVKRLVKL